MVKRIYISVALFTALISAIWAPHCCSQISANGFIKEDSMNLAILVLDFLSYEFEEANISYYPLCDSCDLDSLPFVVKFTSPMDYGEILFKYSPNADTLFYASIWWMGMGEIYYPDQFLPSSEFEYQTSSISLPNHVQYFDYWLIPGYCSEERFKEKADSAWMTIDSLLIVEEISQYTFRVGIYAYTPSVGMFDPYLAKWIIFLYYGNSFSTGITDLSHNTADVRSFPNPFTTSTTLSFRLEKPDNVRFTVYNVHSQIVYTIEGRREKGEQKIEWNAEGLPAGMYFYRLEAGDRICCGKLVVGGW